MSIYTRKPTNSHTQFQVIADAYKAFGLPAPTQALEIKALVNAEDASVQQTAARLALEALTTDQEPRAWYSDALEQMRDAQAREALTAAFNRSHAAAVTRSLPRYLADAAADLKPAVDKAIKKLTTAAAKLPAGPAALDPEANINNDSGAALQDARHALTALAHAASIYQAGSPDGISPALHQLLPIVDLPAAEVEHIASSLGESVSVLNREDLDATYTIRDISKQAKDDIDLTIIDIARGAYEGARLSLADPEEHGARRRNAMTAYQRQTIKEGTVRVFH